MKYSCRVLFDLPPQLNIKFIHHYINQFHQRIYSVHNNNNNNNNNIITTTTIIVIIIIIVLVITYIHKNRLIKTIKITNLHDSINVF